MSDGRLNKCKECTKIDVSENYSYNRTNPDFIEKDRKRGRDKYHRLGYKSIKVPYERKKVIMENYYRKYPEKKRARYKVNKIKCRNGFHLHHWSYNIGDEKSVIELSVKNHNIAHRFLIYDQERMMYRSLDGILLDTKESHEAYILDIISKHGE